MEPQYLRNYHYRHINHHKLHARITEQFQQTGDSVDKMRLYDELLFVLDEHSRSGRAPRPVCDQLFNQSKNREDKSSISKMVWAYIENLETAKLCLLRDQNKINQLKHQQANIPQRQNTFIYLQIIQVSIYSHMGKDGILTYVIQPSNIPPVTLTKASNPTLNHEYTIKLDHATHFNIIFMASGINIAQWTFPDSPELPQGQYHRLITSQNITFEVKIKYLPKYSSTMMVENENSIKKMQNQKHNSRAAFENLVLFEPFVNKNAIYKPELIEFEEEDSDFQGCFAFLGDHVRNLYFLLILTILGQCLLGYFNSIQFIDIMLAFYTIGLIQNREITSYKDYTTTFLTITLAFIVCIIKSFIGMAHPPFYSRKGFQTFMLVICVIFEVGLIGALAITLNNLSTMARQRDLFFYNLTEGPKEIPVQTQREDSIWEESRVMTRPNQ